jgi:vitamin B12 transporter
VTYSGGGPGHEDAMKPSALKLCRIAAATACALALPPEAAAQSQPAALPQVVITPARTRQTLDDVLPATTVITRADIERWQYTDAVTALARQTGIEFARTGGAGSAASLFVRGTNSSQVLVLVDGVRLNAGVGGAPALGGIALDSIDRIEIVRGNLSSLYGSAAVGGVVQIFTRGGQQPGWSVAVEAGEGRTRNLAVSGAVGADDLRVGGSLARRSSRQFSAIDATRVTPGPFAGGANPDLDGNRNANGSLGLTWHPQRATLLAINGWASRNETDFDSTFDGPAAAHVERSRLAGASAQLRHRLSDRWQTQLQWGAVNDHTRNRASDPFSFNNAEFESDNRQVNWSNEFAVTDGVIAQVGLELLRQRGASTAFDPSFGNALTRHSREVKSGWLGVNGRADDQQVQVNVRHDDYTDVGGATTGLVSYGYRVSPQLRAVAQFSNAFRAPSFSDLYFPFFGNPGLGPERSRSAELGLDYAVQSTTARLAAYQTRTRGLIVYDPTTMRAENVDQARITGVEVAAATRRGAWHFDANAMLVRPLDTGRNERLLRRAPYTINAGVAYDTGVWRAGFEATHAGERADLDINTFQRVELASYTIVRLVAALRAARNITLTLRVENATDKRYEIVSGYNVQPRTIVVGVSLHP